MAYKIIKQKTETEQLELFDEFGKLQLSICVRLDAPGLSENIRARHVDIVKAKDKITELQRAGLNTSSIDYEEALESVGNAIICLFEAVFGKEDSDKIRDFYSENTVQMCSEILPFILQVVIPKVNDICKKNRKVKKLAYKNKRFFN